MHQICWDSIRNIIAYIVIIYGSCIVLLPLLQIANFTWYTPLCFYSGVALLAVGLIVSEKRVFILAFFLLLWTFIAPFFFLLLAMVSASTGYSE